MKKVLVFLILTALVVFFILGRNKFLPRTSERSKEDLESTGETLNSEVQLLPQEPSAPVPNLKGQQKMMSPTNSYAIIETIGAIITHHDTAKIAQLEDYLAHPKPAVIVASLDALAALKSTESVPLIKQTYANNAQRPDGYHETIRLAALEALGNIGDEHSRTFLEDQMLSLNNTIYADQIVESLGHIGSKESLPALERYAVAFAAKAPKDKNDLPYGSWRISMQQLQQVIETIKKK